MGARLPSIALLVLFYTASAQAAKTIEGITFASEPGKIYVLLTEAERLLGAHLIPVEHRKSLRKLTNGTPLVTLAALESVGAKVTREEGGTGAKVKKRLRAFQVDVGSKRAEVNLAKQRLFAWQGKRLVLETHISSGRRGSTPAGNFTAGPYKARRHYSSRYDNAPMPWSVQINGHIFIHGFTSVPDYPASHGCIRLPLDGGNPAKFFYDWIDIGTPVSVKKE